MTQMSQEERDAIIRELLSAQRDISSKLSALGVVDEAPDANKMKKAPDGGPVSLAHRFLRTQITPTMEVRRKQPGGGFLLVNIRQEDYNADIHEKVESVRKRRQLGDTTPITPKVSVSTTPRDELLTMPMPKLRALPEVSMLPEIPKDKGQLVDAILRVREESASAVA